MAYNRYGEWYCDKCGGGGRDGDCICPPAPDLAEQLLAEQNAKATAARRAKAKAARQAREQVMKDSGLVKVKGALGGTYWE